MKKVSAIVLSALGIGGILMGLLFLVGSAGKGYRLAAAAVMLVVGAALTALGVRFGRQANAVTPERLRLELLALAKRSDGEVAEAEIAAAFGDRAVAASEELAAMVRAGICRERLAGGATYYLFPELQPRLVVRRCEYCQAELPLDDDVTECPRCGGTVDTRRETRAVSGDDLYSMD
ncbi:MAG: hypothetical protein JRI23_26020 [Deltaproteobacteria bacterium]|jgi:Zn finger protein HypA/HybF involved in hydrogenase expression|nr:hypothetical protein [Deltaproteobacteria bacterium]MBW2535486.1 hypothetical protein [Deltaproteobacteria bacterium]